MKSFSAALLVAFSAVAMAQDSLRNLVKGRNNALPGAVVIPNAGSISVSQDDGPVVSMSTEDCKLVASLSNTRTVNIQCFVDSDTVEAAEDAAGTDLVPIGKGNTDMRCRIDTPIGCRVTENAGFVVTGSGKLQFDCKFNLVKDDPPVPVSCSELED